MPTFSETYPDLFKIDEWTFKTRPKEAEDKLEKNKAEANKSVTETISRINENGPHYKVSTTYKVVELATEFEVTLHGSRVFTVGKSINLNQLISKIHWIYGMRNHNEYFEYIKAHSDPEALTSLRRLIASVKATTRGSKEDLAHQRMEEAKRELIAYMSKLNTKYRFSKELMVKLAEDSAQLYCVQTILTD